MGWSDDELTKIDQADDLKMAPFREDGDTYGTPTWIWEVVVMAASMCAATMDRSHVGIRPLSVKRPAGSLQQAWLARSPSSRSTAPLTTGSTLLIAPNMAGANICRR
jgi:hypothetical protein